VFGFLLITMRASDSWYRSARIISVPMGWLGTISYSLYLVHNFNLRLSAEAARLVLKPLGIASPSVALYFVQILILIIIATVFHYFAERPFLKRPLAAVRRPD
jgi:peptidoglycan/LPS O-acetylase OafA/YrhL